MRKRILVFGLLMLAPALVLAAPPFEPVELSDPELAQLRGRYVLPDHIVHFGITLTSSWEQSGQQLGASVSLQAQHGVQPVLTITPVSSDGGAMPQPGSGMIIGGQGLAQVDGISQSVRTAGDLNSAVNGIQINIERDGQAPDLAGGMPLGNGYSHSNGLGTVSVSATQGKLQLGIATHGQGRSVQQLGGGLLQDTRILSSQNTVLNTARLDVVMQRESRSMDVLNCNLDPLRTLRPTGY